MLPLFHSFSFKKKTTNTKRNEIKLICLVLHGQNLSAMHELYEKLLLTLRAIMRLNFVQKVK